MRSGRSELGADAAATGAMEVTAKMLVPVCGGLDDHEEAREMEQFHQTWDEEPTAHAEECSGARDHGYLGVAATDERAFAVSTGGDDGGRERERREMELGRDAAMAGGVAVCKQVCRVRTSG